MPHVNIMLIKKWHAGHDLQPLSNLHDGIMQWEQINKICGLDLIIHVQP